MPQKTITNTAVKTKEKPIFAKALVAVLKTIGLNLSLGSFNETENGTEAGQEKYEYHYINPESVRNWSTGRSRPTATNYDLLKGILSETIESRRVFPLDIAGLAKKMEEAMPGRSREIEDLAAWYASVEAAAKAANATVSEELVEAAKEVILKFLSMAYNTEGIVMQEEEPVDAASSKRIDVAVWSPVNVWVYLNDLHHPLMYIDHNSGFGYKVAPAQVHGEFDLIFASKGFAKKVRFCADAIDSVEYDLGAILTRNELDGAYDRQEALAALSKNAVTGYTFETLSAVGTHEDLESIARWLEQWADKTVEDGTINYQIALACEAIGKLSVKYGDGNYVRPVEETYKTYLAKRSYGHIIEKALTLLHSYFGSGT